MLKSLLYAAGLVIAALVLAAPETATTFTSPVTPAPTPTVSDQCVYRCIRERSPIGYDACWCLCQPYESYEACMGFETPTPAPVGEQVGQIYHAYLPMLLSAPQ